MTIEEVKKIVDRLLYLVLYQGKDPMIVQWMIAHNCIFDWATREIIFWINQAAGTHKGKQVTAMGVWSRAVYSQASADAEMWGLQHDSGTVKTEEITKRLVEIRDAGAKLIDPEMSVDWNLCQMTPDLEVMEKMKNALDRFQIEAWHERYGTKDSTRFDLHG